MRLYIALPHDSATTKPLALGHDGGSNASVCHSYGGALDNAARMNEALQADGITSVHWAVIAVEWDGGYMSY